MKIAPFQPGTPTMARQATSDNDVSAMLTFTVITTGAFFLLSTGDMA